MHASSPRSEIGPLKHGARAAEMNEWRWENVLESQIYDLHYHRERGECVHSEQGLIVHLGGRSFEEENGRAGGDDACSASADLCGARRGRGCIGADRSPYLANCNTATVKRRQSGDSQYPILSFKLSVAVVVVSHARRIFFFLRHGCSCLHSDADKLLLELTPFREGEREGGRGRGSSPTLTGRATGFSPSNNPTERDFARSSG